MSLNRRRFLSVTGKSLIGLTLGGTSLLGYAREKPMLDEGSAQAKGYDYKAKSDKEDQKCANCAFVAGQKGQALNCPLFQQNSVSADGWCKSWVLNPNA